jgi:hypothetical protein
MAKADEKKKKMWVKIELHIITNKNATKTVHTKPITV